MMKVSIIVPVYNAEKYLDKCLNSIIQQTLKEIEIIVINDGSTDNSENVINKYLKYDNVKYIKKNNDGLSSTRNLGIRIAKGEYIGFVDNDDYVDLDMFEKMYLEAKKNNSDIVVCGTEIFGKNKKIICHARNYLIDNYKDYFLSQPTAWNKIYKRNLFTKDFMFNEQLSIDDLELVPCFILKTKKISFIDMPFYKYIKTDESITRKKEFDKKYLDIYDVLQSIENRFKKHHQYNNYYEEIEFLYIEHLIHGTGRKISKYKNYGKKYLKEINIFMDKKYPHWMNNKYLKKMSFKHKIVLYLLKKNMITIIRLLNKIEEL